MQKKALFLDRDGTINVEKHYLYRVEDFEFREGIFQLTSEFYSKGYLIFVVSNQAGIARGYYREEDVVALHHWMTEQFREKGIIITEVAWCPHYPAISGECPCRKPRPGMILGLSEKYGVDRAASVLIGNKMSDIEAGLNAGIGTNWLVRETGKVTFENVIVYKSGNTPDQRLL